MQLLTGDVIDNQHYAMVAALAPPIVEAKDEQHSLSLVEKILSKIRSLPEGRQASLFALLKPNLEGEELRVAFNMLLALKASLAKSLGLIEFLFSLKDEFDAREALREILKFIANTEIREDKSLVIEAFIAKAKCEKAKVEAFEYFSLESAIKDLVIRVDGFDFELKDKVRLMGRLFNLSGKDKSHQLIAMQEYYKDELIKSINNLKNSSQKYLALLVMLKDFPLEQKEVNKLASFALEILVEELNKNVTGNENNQKENIPIKEKIELLVFLNKEQKESIVRDVYNELWSSKILSVNRLECMGKLFYYCRKKEVGKEQQTIIKELYRQINNLIKLDFIHTQEELTDQDYLNFVRLLVSDEWIEIWGKSVKYGFSIVTEWMDSPITQMDSLLLLLEKIKPSKLRKEIANKSLEIISLIRGEEEGLVFTTKLVKYLPKRVRGKILSKCLEKLEYPWNDYCRVEVLIALLPHLRSGLRKKAYYMAMRLGDYFDVNWTCVAFSSYLEEREKGRVIECAIKVMDEPNDLITINQKVLMIKQIINFGLEPVNQG